MIYIVCYVVAALALHCSVNGKKSKRILFFILSVLSMVLLAALRSSNVGIDVKVYAEPFTKLALTQPSFFSYMQVMTYKGIEAGYAIMTYVGARFFGGLPAVLGLCQLFIVFIAFARLRDFKDVAPVWLMTLIYLLMFGNQSLTILRQSIAMSIVFYGSRYIEKNVRKYILFLIIAMLFHISAILGVALLVIDKASKGELSAMKSIALVIAMLAFIVFFDYILQMVISVFFSDTQRYSTYLSSDSGYVSSIRIIYKLLTVMIVILSRNRLRDVRVIKVEDEKKNENCCIIVQNTVFSYYLLIVIFDLCLSFLTMYDGDCYRFALYFAMFVPVIISQFRKCFVNRDRWIVDMAIVVMYVAYWVNFFVISNEGGTWPYILNSQFL